MVYADGNMKIVPEKSIESQEQIVTMIEEEGLIHTFSFGPTLINDGVATGDYSAFTAIGGANPRTAIGMVEPGHFKFLVLDGRVPESRGVKLLELEGIMAGLGCKTAYNFDGGYSSTLFYDGNVINAITGKETERGVTDIIYLTES
jgi:exopolysaccharide biosynthesis protein